MDHYIFLLRNLFMIFFKDAIWVAGFFFLFLKTFGNPELNKICKYLAIAILVILFLYSMLVNL